MHRSLYTLIALLLVATTLCNFSGVKFGINSEFFKAISQVNFNNFLQNKTLINHTEVNGSFLFKYELKIENLNVVDAQGPKSVEVVNFVNDNGFRAIHLDFKDINVAIRTDFSIKYAFVNELGKQILIQASVESVNGDFYINEKGEVIISQFIVEFGTLSIDFHSSFINFLYKLTEHLIVDQIEKLIKQLTGIISSSLNKWVNSEFLYDLGFGIGFNFTNIDKPTLIPYTKKYEGNASNNFLSNLEVQQILDKETTILEFGIHGSVYPNLNPEVSPNIPPAVNMTYIDKYFNNEIQILISDYTINTLLFMGQQSGFLHKEFTTLAKYPFPFDFNVKGLSTIIPEFAIKYPNDNFDIQMKAYILTNGFEQPKIVSSKNEGLLKLNFGLEFETTISDDPFDDPVKDLKLNVTATCKLHYIVSRNALNVILLQIDVTNIDIIIDELNINKNNMKLVIEKEIDDHVLPVINSYITNVKVADLLNKALGLKFSKFDLSSEDQYLLLTLALGGLN